MIPRLRARAALILAMALALIFAGAIAMAPVLLALGAAVLTSLVTLYVNFFPTAIYLRRKKVDVAWWARQAENAVAGTALPLELTIRNHGFRRLYVRGIRPITSEGIAVDDIDQPVVSPGHQAVITTTLRLRAFGRWCVHGCELHFRDPLDLFVLRAYFPSFLELRANAPAAAQRIRLAAAPHAPQGYESTRSRRAGQGDEIHELREYKPGDPFKNINWKASARHRQLITRELEASSNLAHAFVLDIGAAMREGPAGKTLLDASVAAIWRHASELLAGGHRISLTTFDAAPHWHLPLGTTARWRHALRAMLAELPHAADAATTDVQPAHLVELVAHYLREQHGLSFRVAAPPALDASRWTNLQIGADANFYDLGEMIAHLAGVSGAAPGATPWRELTPPDPDPAIAVLRRFSQSRCLPLPPAGKTATGARGAALAAALAVAAKQRGGQLSIWSSGDRLLEHHAAISAQILACRRQGIVVMAPLAAPMIEAAPLDEIGRAAWYVLTRQRSQLRAVARQTWGALGIATT